MQPDLRKTVRRITPALLVFSAYMVFYPAPAEACHKYVSPYTGKTGCGAKRADKKKGLSTKSAGQVSNTTKNANTPPTPPKSSGQSGTSSVTSAASGGRLPWPSGLACPWRININNFENWRGSRVDVLGGWIYRKTWADMRRYFNPYRRQYFTSNAGTIVLGMPLLTNESKGDFDGCAKGKYDSHFRFAAMQLRSYEPATRIIRLGWEPNGTWYPWSINGNYAKYKSCFNRVAAILKSTDPKLKISWSLAGGPLRRNFKSFFSAAYPGNRYVDYIDTSLYDHWPPAKTQRDWDRSFLPMLDFLVRFAKTNDKKVGVGEWALSQWRGNGGGDNPLFIRNVYQFFKSNAKMISYEIYYNCGSDNSYWRIYPGKANPRGSVEYRRLW